MDVLAFSLFVVLACLAIRERQKICKWMRLTDFDRADDKLRLERELEDEKVRSCRKIADLEKAILEYESKKGGQ